ncbi:hypothetical protein [Halobellus inordinatus]|uniref:hypothetical protein n=1 Tax=Halobellus inordinatus TaxID=1126236 RepID=UPI00210D8E3C|nr:hypothetical protein [Halobellus inordinatus]
MASRSDAGTSADAPTESVASALSAAAFVRVVCHAGGDALAAAGLLARGLRSADVPFQVRVASLDAAAPAADDGVFVAVGTEHPDADVTIRSTDGPVSRRAYDVAIALGRDDGARDDVVASDVTLALAGVAAAGAHPGSVAGSLVEAADGMGAIERRPGVAIPVDDVVDGLTHSTLLRAPFSGDVDTVESALASLADPTASDAETRRSIASLVAFTVAGDDAATPRAATAVERALRPYATPDGPMATLGGFADVLHAVAVERPGTGVALSLGHGGREAALDAWRTHGTAVHRAIDDGHTGRYDGVFVVRGDVGGNPDARDHSTTPGRLATVARLVRDFRSPEPLVVALDDGVAALSARETGAADAAAALASEFTSADAAWTGDATRATARFDADAADADVIAAIREAVR